jgi:Thiamine pyrophosphate enzyme, central domain
MSREESAVPLIDRLGGDLPRGPVTVELDDIQATILRYRPEPYHGTHVMLHVEDAQAGREFVQRLTPHVESAADWWQAREAWISVAISYTGLVALGVPKDWLQTFPEAFRVGMAARADKLRDYGPNDPKNWDRPFGTGLMELAEKMQLPVAVISTAKAVIDETFPYYLGIYNGKASQPHVREAIETSDCLLSIGYRPIEVTTGDFTASLPANTIRARGHSVDIGADNYQAVTLKEVLRGVIDAVPHVTNRARR